MQMGKVTVISVFWLPTIAGPEVGRLESIECSIVLHGQHVVVDLEQITVARQQMRQVQRLR